MRERPTLRCVPWVLCGEELDERFFGVRWQSARQRTLTRRWVSLDIDCGWYLVQLARGAKWQTWKSGLQLYRIHAAARRDSKPGTVLQQVWRIIVCRPYRDFRMIWGDQLTYRMHGGLLSVPLTGLCFGLRFLGTRRVCKVPPGFVTPRPGADTTDLAVCATQNV